MKLKLELLFDFGLCVFGAGDELNQKEKAFMSAWMDNDIGRS